MGELVLDHPGAYLGGLDAYPENIVGRINLSSDCISVTVKRQPPAACLNWEDCLSLHFAGREVANSKKGTIMFLGLAGAILAKGSKLQTDLYLNTKKGERAYYVLDDFNPSDLRAHLHLVLERFDIAIESFGAMSRPL